MRLGETDFPWAAGMLDGRQRRSARPAIMPRNQNMIRVGFGDARRHGADANFRHQLHADARCTVRVLQIVNQLRQILDRINIVMRGRTDQLHPRRRVPQPPDVLINFVTRKLPALAGLRALRHLDLQFIGVGQIIDRHAKPAGRDLLDRRPPQLRRSIRPMLAGNGLEAPRILAALAGVRFSAEIIHRHRQRFMGFGRNRSKRHCPRAKPLHDFLCRLNFLQRHRRRRRFSA